MFPELQNILFTLTKFYYRRVEKYFCNSQRQESRVVTCLKQRASEVINKNMSKVF